jgi:small subunit ribosomal protein S17
MATREALETETMAEDEKTPETVGEEVRGEAGDDPTKSAEAVAAEAGASAETAAPSAPATTTRRERLEVRRTARRPAQRGPVTPEQREEERRARRAETAKQRRAYRAKLKTRRDATTDDRTGQEPAPEHTPGKPRVRTGVVVSAKGEKTITVKIDVVRRHRRYHKIMRSTLKLYAHDEANNANEGDTVRVVECRPMSRSKRWRLTEVLERAK